MAKDQKEKFPTTLFVKLEDNWWSAEASLDELAEANKKVKVAIYDLREVRTLVTKPVLE